MKPGQWSFIVPEPIRDARILSVTTHNPASDNPCPGVSILDITDCERQSLGGYAVVTLETRAKGKFKTPNQTRLLALAKNLAALIPS